MAGITLGATAAAQTTPPGATSNVGLDEVAATAQKRAEGVQSVPLSITTFSASELEQKAITNFFDYATKVPNLAFAMTGDGIGTARTISIRGISGDNTTGYYIDETPLPDSLDPRVLDIDHIEVLRGPQGTLYGARSMGGTVRIITKAANLNDVEGDLHAGISDTWNTDRPNYTADGVLNIPLVQDRVALRVSGFFDNEAGYFKRSYCTNINTTANNLNATPTCTPLSVYTDPSLVTLVNNVGAIDTYGGAAHDDQAHRQPDDHAQGNAAAGELNGFPMADVLTDTANGYGYPVPTPPVPPTLPTLRPDDFIQARMFNTPEGGYDHWHLYSLGIKWQSELGELVSSTAYFDRVVNETEDQSDFIYATLLGGYQGIPSGLSEEKSRPALRRGDSLRLQAFRAFAVRGWRLLLGFPRPPAVRRLYPPSAAPGYGNVLINVFGSCPPPSVATSGYLCPNPQHPDEIFGQDYHTDIKEPAVFGELAYEFTPALKGTVGLRWSQIQTTGGGYIEGSVTQSNADYYKGIGQIVDAPVTTTESSLTPKGQLDYHLNPDAMVYTMVAKGFRPGGLVPSVPAALCQSELPAGVTVNETRQYQSDSLWSYELGTKTAWLDRRVTVDAAAFYIDWKNIQQNILLGCGFQYRANAGAATSKGGEVEVNARPIEPLQLSAGVGYQDAKITATGTDSPQTVGSPVFEVPDWTANASAAWTQPVWGTDHLVTSLDYSYVGRSYSANNLTAANGFATRERPAYQIFNGSIALKHNLWDFSFVAKNILNEHANLADSRSIAAETEGRPRLITNQPQTFGLEVRKHF